MSICAELEKCYGIIIQEAFSGKEPQAKLLYAIICLVILVASVILWKLNWRYINKRYHCYIINTVNALHRLFIDASLVLISAVACWYSMMGSGMGGTPKRIFALIVPIAIFVVIIINFCEVYHEYIQDVENAKVIKNSNHSFIRHISYLSGR